jgi:hypothetical protein
MRKIYLSIGFLLCFVVQSCEKSKSKEQILDLINLNSDSANCYPLFVGGVEYDKSCDGELYINTSEKIARKTSYVYSSKENYLLDKTTKDVEEGKINTDKMEFLTGQNHFEISMPWNSSTGGRTANLKISVDFPFSKLHLLEQFIPITLQEKIVELQKSRYKMSNDSAENYRMLRTVKMDSLDIIALFQDNPSFSAEDDYFRFVLEELEELLKNTYLVNYNLGTSSWAVSANKNLTKKQYFDLLTQFNIQVGETKFKNVTDFELSELIKHLETLETLALYYRQIYAGGHGKTTQYGNFTKLKGLNGKILMIDRIGNNSTSLSLTNKKLPIIFSDGKTELEIYSLNERLKTFSGKLLIQGKTYVINGNSELNSEETSSPIITPTYGTDRSSISKKYSVFKTLNYDLSLLGYSDINANHRTFNVKLTILESNKVLTAIFTSSEFTDVKLEQTIYINQVR